jgi:sigma-B regulation protein RsbU (phosphoserine phosphatase)
MLVTAMGHQALLQQERYERDLQFAHTLQESFLPGRPPEVPGLLVSARYVPALEVGGDLYDFIPLPDDRLGVIIGDVSGKGVPAALFMARFSSDIRGLAMSGLSPGAVMTRVNRMVAERSRRGLFVTATYLVVDPACGDVAISNAGHPVPMIFSGEGRPVAGIAEAIDIPLGIVPDTRYPEGHCRLESGQCLLLMTDGITDARNAAGGRFGLDRVTECLAAGPARPRETIERLLGNIYRFVGSDAQVDDLTVVGVGRT